MNHAQTSISTEIFAGAITSVFQCLAPLWYERCLVALNISILVLVTLIHIREHNIFVKVSNGAGELSQVYLHQLK
jgi:hypothetical protein